MATLLFHRVNRKYKFKIFLSQFFIYHAGQIMCLSQAVLNFDCAMYNRSAYLKMSNYFLTIYNSMDEDETLRELI